MTQSSVPYRAAWWLSIGMLPPATGASAAGLAIPGPLYGEPGVAAVIQGQDVVTLLVVPVLALALVKVRGGSSRGLIVWAGVLGYLLYTYTGAALVYDFNALFPAYVALFSASAFALALLVSAVDVEALARRFDVDTPRRSVAGFLGGIALVLGLGEAVQVASAVLSGEAPVIEGTEASLNFVYAPDLGLIVPLSAVGALLLWRGSPWGYLIAGFMLTKSATMGLALVSMSWFAARAGLPGDSLAILWVIVAGGGLGLSGWFLRHCSR